MIADMLLDATTMAVCNKSPDTCCICLDEMSLDQPVRMLRCAHRMHGPCLKRWLIGKSSTVCPLCKSVSKATHPNHM